MMPTLAMFRHDLRTLTGSWLVRLWLVFSVLVSAFLTLVLWNNLQTASVIAWLLWPFLVLPWFVVVIVLGVSPVTGARAEAVADGILSRPVTRYEFMIAAWLARLIAVLGVFLIATVPFILLVATADRTPPEDKVSPYGIVLSLFAAGLVQALLVSLAFLMGTLLQRTLLAIVVLVFVWWPASAILSIWDIEEFSPNSLAEAIPTLAQRSWGPPPDEETDDASVPDLGALPENAADFWRAVSGEAPKPQPRRYLEGDEAFDNVSPLRLTLGYALPTLAAFALATWCFCRRDL
jgi:ABC-type transport system involved in multi-copper enzyme maturation permease subunit